MPQAAVLIEDRNAELFEPDIALPAQFNDLWAQSARLAPGPRLALAVLQLAVMDFLKYRSARLNDERRLYRRARSWLASADRSWPFSYLNVCESLRIAPELFRTGVFATSPGEGRATLREVGKLLDIGRR